MTSSVIGSSWRSFSASSVSPAESKAIGVNTRTAPSAAMKARRCGSRSAVPESFPLRTSGSSSSFLTSPGIASLKCRVYAAITREVHGDASLCGSPARWATSSMAQQLFGLNSSWAPCVSVYFTCVACPSPCHTYSQRLIVRRIGTRATPVDMLCDSFPKILSRPLKGSLP